ncbi:MAG: hypothetical protein V2J10_01485, partial [Wenzhouxiangella sp.]|nr:hypothetical protein [Wenzhouxiangella sp.]
MVVSVLECQQAVFTAAPPKFETLDAVRAFRRADQAATVDNRALRAADPGVAIAAGGQVACDQPAGFSNLE